MILTINIVCCLASFTVSFSSRCLPHIIDVCRVYAEYVAAYFEQKTLFLDMPKINKNYKEFWFSIDNHDK